MSDLSRWPDADKHLERALELPAADRGKYLEREVRDPELRAALAAILAEADNDFLEPAGALQSPVFKDLEEELEGEDQPPMPKRIGAYRLTREIGRGGMARVFEGERVEGGFTQKVAVKLVRDGHKRKDLYERFEQERQILANLRHPSIAQLYEGGRTETGEPYFVMELIEGKSIETHCRQTAADLHTRIRLFLEVAEAVGFAHSNLVVHRDLKSSNVLVNENGQAKLLDFGIARLVAPEPLDATATGQRMLTPEYASPEQLRGLPITTGSDVYQLGHLLYRLLAQRSPYEGRTTTPAYLQEAILTDTPVLPSQALAQSTSADPESTAPAWAASLRGDLDAIVMKALRKEPERRYATVRELIDDLDAYLAGRPIRARPDSWSYRTGKFLRRHRIAVGLAALSALFLVGFAITMAIQAKRIAHERDAHRAVADFLKELFTVSDPSEARGNSITAREILDRGLQRMEFSLPDQPETRTELMTTMGEVYFRLGLYDAAEKLLVESAESQLELFGENDVRTLRSRSALAEVRRRQGNLAEAEEMHRGNLKLQRVLLGPHHPDIVTSLNGLGLSLLEQGNLDEAEGVMRESIEVARVTFEPTDPRFTGTLANLAILHRYQGRYDDAEQVHRESLERAQREWGQDHPSTLALMHDLAYSVWRQSRFDEAQRMYEELVPLRQRVLGEEHQDTIGSMNNLAGVYMMNGQLETAEALYLEVYELSNRLFGSDHPDTLRALNNIGQLLGRADRLDESAERLRQVLEGRRRVLGPEHRETLSTMYNLAHTYYRQGRYDDSERLHRETLALRQQTLGEEHPATLSSIAGIAAALEGNVRLNEAEALLVDLLETRRRVLGDSYYDTIWSMHDLASVLHRLGRIDEARLMMEEAVERALEELGEDHPDTVLFGETLLDWETADGEDSRQGKTPR